MINKLFIIIFIAFFLIPIHAVYSLEKEPLRKCRLDLVDACVRENFSQKASIEKTLREIQLQQQSIKSSLVEENNALSIWKNLSIEFTYTLENIYRETSWWNFWSISGPKISKNEFTSIYKFLMSANFNSNMLIDGFLYTKTENNFAHVSVPENLFTELQESSIQMQDSIKEFQRSANLKEQQIKLLNSEYELYETQISHQQTRITQHDKMCNFGCQERYCPSN